jgi:hypothetical protein
MEEEAYYFGLKPSEFWCMTMREYKVFIKNANKRMSDEIEREEYRLAVLLSHSANLHIGKKGKRLKPEDFISKKKKQNSDKKKNTMSPQMMAEILKGYTLAVGGDIKGG